MILFHIELRFSAFVEASVSTQSSDRIVLTQDQASPS